MKMDSTANKTEMDLRTPYQRALQERQREVCSQYSELRKNNPGTSAFRLMTAVAQLNGMTYQGVRNILLNAGLYTPKH